MNEIQIDKQTQKQRDDCCCKYCRCIGMNISSAIVSSVALTELASDVTALNIFGCASAALYCVINVWVLPRILIDMHYGVHPTTGHNGRSQQTMLRF